MRVLKRNRHWLSDVQSAYEAAIKGYDNGRFGISDKTSLYTLAPEIAAKRRGIDSKKLIEEMREYILEQVESDVKGDAEELLKYKFHFVIAYIHCHVPAGIIDEFEADKIMEYVNENWDLFDNA